ncbi:hypothetical protein QJS66_10565 [Kocuria rhizophila]|nr:hypothetical protein QJS66_10565 [Kocuria rhizophila]
MSMRQGLRGRAAEVVAREGAAEAGACRLVLRVTTTPHARPGSRTSPPPVFDLRRNARHRRFSARPRWHRSADRSPRRSPRHCGRATAARGPGW